MLKRIREYWLENPKAGQNMTEYILVFVGVVVVLIVAAGPSGIFTQKIEKSMDEAVTGTKCLALKVCYDPEGCPSVCGNDCCEPGEDAVSCGSDCDCSVDSDCDDIDLCTIDSCNSGTSKCQYTPVNCDDSDACTIDSCEPAIGCQYSAVDCNDGNACTIDSCNTATGCTYAGVDCNDSNACTVDSCNAATGCEYSAVNCNDSNACTIDSCNSATGCEYAAVDCNDGDPCTTDSCNSIAGCQHLSCCNLPDGGTIAHALSQTYYLAPNAPCGGICSWEVRLCVDGILSGLYTNPGCGPEVCADCVGPDGVAIAHGSARTYYQTATVPCESVCVSQSRLCTDGSLSGTYTNGSCSVDPCPPPPPTCVPGDYYDWTGTCAQFCSGMGGTATGVGVMSNGCPRVAIPVCPCTRPACVDSYNYLLAPPGAFYSSKAECDTFDRIGTCGAFCYLCNRMRFTMCRCSCP